MTCFNLCLIFQPVVLGHAEAAAEFDAGDTLFTLEGHVGTIARNHRHSDNLVDSKIVPAIGGDVCRRQAVH